MSILYEQDFNLWLETTIKQIRNQDYQAVDWAYLLQELEDMGKSEKRAFVSNLVILIAHLLKLKVQSDAPKMMKRSWYNSVDEHRLRVKRDLEENPSFTSFMVEAVTLAYKDAKKLAIKEGQRAQHGVRKANLNEYPEACPFTLEQILDEDFY